MGVNRYNGFDEHAVRTIRQKARQLMRHAGFTDADREDLEQEFALHVWRRKSRHDPALGSFHTFIARIIDNYAANLIAERCAGKRDFRREVESLDETVEFRDGMQVQRRDLFDQDACLSLTGRAKSVPGLSIDFRRVLQQLPDRQRELCLMLMATTVSEVALMLGMPRGTLYEEIKKLKKALETAGLGDYV